MRILVDVDGVVAEMMDGFEKFFFERTGHLLRPNLSTLHSISKSEAHAELHARFGLDEMLRQFLSLPNVYQEYVDPVPDSTWAVGELVRAGHEVGFVTAIFRKAPWNYDSKLRWVAQWFPDVPMLTSPAEQKGWVHGDWAIDDRYDTCMRWEAEGTRSLLFRRPWNEAPPGTLSYNWAEIVNELG